MLPIDTGSKEEIDRKLNSFLAQQGRRIPQAILVISYETLRLHADVMHSRSVGMVICDEVCVSHEVLILYYRMTGYCSGLKYYCK